MSLSNKAQKLCDACQARPAAHHTCNATTGEIKDLCMTCFEEIAPAAELESFRSFQQLIRDGKCKYCGAPACAGCGGLSIPGVMEQQPDFWCERCGLNLVEFGSRPENAMPEDFDVRDEAKLERISQQLAEQRQRQWEFMRQRTRERQN